MAARRSPPCRSADWLEKMPNAVVAAVVTQSAFDMAVFSPGFTDVTFHFPEVEMLLEVPLPYDRKLKDVPAGFVKIPLEI
jgi:hypothetical protein